MEQTKKDYFDVWLSLATFRFLNLYLSVDFVVDAFRLALTLKSLLLLGGCFV